MRRSQLGKSPTADEPVSSSPLHQLLPTNRLVTVAETAAALAVSIKTIKRLIKDGELSSFRIGKVTRIHPRDVHAYLNRTDATDESVSLDLFIQHQLNGGSHGTA